MNMFERILISLGVGVLMGAVLYGLSDALNTPRVWPGTLFAGACGFIKHDARPSFTAAAMTTELVQHAPFRLTRHPARLGAADA